MTSSNSKKASVEEGCDPKKRLAPGVYPAVVTPLTYEGGVDEVALAAHCQALLKQGCAGIAPLGTTGESNSLSMVSRRRVIEAIALNVDPGRLIAGTGCCALDDAVELTKAAVRAGISRVLVLPPFYYKEVTEEGLYRFYSELIERVGSGQLGLYLYNFPRHAVVSIPMSLLRRLVLRYPDTVLGIKDSSETLSFMTCIRKELPQLQVFCGMESQFLSCLQQGAAGCITALGNITPQLCVSVFEHRSSPAAGQDAQERLSDVFRHFGQYPIVPALRQVLFDRTGNLSWRRPLAPLMPLSSTQIHELAAARDLQVLTAWMSANGRRDCVE